MNKFMRERFFFNPRSKDVKVVGGWVDAVEFQSSSVEHFTLICVLRYVWGHLVCALVDLFQHTTLSFQHVVVLDSHWRSSESVRQSSKLWKQKWMGAAHDDGVVGLVARINFHSWECETREIYLNFSETWKLVHTGDEFPSSVISFFLMCARMGSRCCDDCN